MRNNSKQVYRKYLHPLANNVCVDVSLVFSILIITFVVETLISKVVFLLWHFFWVAIVYFYFYCSPELHEAKRINSAGCSLHYSQSSAFRRGVKCLPTRGDALFRYSICCGASQRGWGWQLRGARAPRPPQTLVTHATLIASEHRQIIEAASGANASVPVSCEWCIRGFTDWWLLRWILIYLQLLWLSLIHLLIIF